MKTAWRMRPVEVRSRKVPVGRVRLRTSRNLRSPALVVLRRVGRSRRRGGRSCGSCAPGTAGRRCRAGRPARRRAGPCRHRHRSSPGSRSAGAVAPVAHGDGVEGVASAVRCLGHTALDDPGRRLATGRATALAPARSACLHPLHSLERPWQAPDRCSLPWHRGLLSVAVASPQGTPHSRPTHDSLRHLRPLIGDQKGCEFPAGPLIAMG